LEIPNLFHLLVDRDILYLTLLFLADLAGIRKGDFGKCKGKQTKGHKL
jgi:hypothetical protein